MAACSTVVPLGTEIGRPSMVSVTVSMSNRRIISSLRRRTRRRTVRACGRGVATRRLTRVDERRVRIGSLFEWVAAALGVLALIWLLSRCRCSDCSARSVRGRARRRARPTLPPGVPAGATSVPVMLMLDGREIRQGDLHTTADADAAGETAPTVRRTAAPASSASATRAPTSSTASRFYVVCERLEPGGPMRVSGDLLCRESVSGRVSLGEAPSRSSASLLERARAPRCRR